MAGKTLRQSTESSPTMLGDPVSLKAEKSVTEPSEWDRRNKYGGKNLKDVAQQDLQEAKKGNRSMLSDPVSLKAETTDNDPIEDDQMGHLTDRKERDSNL